PFRTSPGDSVARAKPALGAEHLSGKRLIKGVMRVFSDSPLVQIFHECPTCHRGGGTHWGGPPPPPPRPAPPPPPTGPAPPRAPSTREVFRLAFGEQTR